MALRDSVALPPQFRGAEPYQSGGGTEGWNSLTSGQSRLVFALVVCLAAIPFAGPGLSLAWLLLTLGLIAGEQTWFLPPARRAQAGNRMSALFSWLLSAVYAAAGLYFLYFHAGAGQSFGVTLFGVMMFKILVADLANPRRLLLNLIPPAISLAIIQVAAAVSRVQLGKPLEIITILASPIVVFLVFRSVKDDLTRSRQSLTESEARFRMLADHSKDLVVWMGLDGTVFYVSPSARSVGYSPDEVIGRRITDLVHPDDRDHAILVITTLFTGETLDPAIRPEIRFQTGFGTHVWIEGSPTLIRGEDGRASSIISSFRDVSVRRQLEDELLEAKVRAEAASEAKAAFLANMSHEIRTPLTGLIGFSSLLTAVDGLPERAATFARRISTSAQTLLSVVNDILDFSKLDANQVELDPKPFDVHQILGDTIELVSGQAAAKGLALDLEVCADMPKRLLADSSRLGQVILNLVNNAIKFTDAGSVRVIAGYDPGAEQLLVAVSDTGPGIPEDRLNRLFQRFSQVDGSVSRRHGGTGLGLSISKNLVELMGGEIDVSSTERVGSTFRFHIAATRVEDLDVEAVPGPDCDDAALRPAHVLIVDDLDVNRELIRIILESVGHVVAEAASGQEAIQAAGQTRFDLILMDLQMPGMDGIAATRAIRSLDSPNRDAPILALSANVLAEHRLASASAGMNDHFGKPIIPAELLAAVAFWSRPGSNDNADVTATREAEHRNG